MLVFDKPAVMCMNKMPKMPYAAKGCGTHNLRTTKPIPVANTSKLKIPMRP